MPHKPYWFRDLATITHSIESMQEPFIDRHGVQHLFSVSRSEACRLITRIGCVRVGAAHVVTRAHLLKWLRQVRTDEGYEMEMQRVSRLEARLLREKPVLFVPASSAPVRSALELPENIQLQAGRLVIEFSGGAQGLLRALQSISEAAARDWPGFQAACEDTDGCKTESRIEQRSGSAAVR